MNSRKFSSFKDYQVFSRWLREHSWPDILPDLLPNEGLVVEYNSVPICMGFLYQTDSKICWLEWIIKDKKMDQTITSEALDILVVDMIELAKKLRFKSIFTSVQNKRLIDRYSKHGFIKSDEGMTNMMRNLWP